MALKLNIIKIENERKRFGFQKQELAKKIGISNGMLSHIYKYKRQLKYADKFAKVFNMESKDLLSQ